MMKVGIPGVFHATVHGIGGIIDVELSIYR
jgi:hypothetical protein